MNTKQTVLTLVALFTIAPYALHAKKTNDEAKQAFITYMDQAAKEKVDWLNYAKQIHEEKFNLMAKHTQECAAFKGRLFQSLKENEATDWNSWFHEAKTVHKQHGMEWAKLCTEQYERGKALHKKHSEAMKMLLKEEREEMAEGGSCPASAKTCPSGNQTS